MRRQPPPLLPLLPLLLVATACALAAVPPASRPPTASSFSRQAPGAASVAHVDLYDMTTTLGLGRADFYEQMHFLTALVALANRAGPSVFVLLTDADAMVKRLEKKKKKKEKEKMENGDGLEWKRSKKAWCNRSSCAPVIENLHAEKHAFF